MEVGHLKSSCLYKHFCSFLDVSTPETSRKQAESSVVNGNLVPEAKLNGISSAQLTGPRKRLLKAPTLAELDSSDSEVRCEVASLFLPSLQFCQFKEIMQLRLQS